MNPDTRVVINSYAGDMHLVTGKLEFYQQHECPVTTLSPDDARVEIIGVESRFGGMVGYEGQVSLDRHARQLEMLLDFPEKYFLFHDSDSICLDPVIPQYLYDEPNHLWSNIVGDDAPARQHGYYPDGFPKLAFQPPYFLSRETVAALLAVAKDTHINPMLPYIDHYWVQLAVNAGVSWRGFPDGVVAPISGDRLNPRCVVPEAQALYNWGLDLAMVFTRNWGGNFFHSIKDAGPMLLLLEARRRYLIDHGDKTIPLPINGRCWMSTAVKAASASQ